MINSILCVSKTEILAGFCLAGMIALVILIPIIKAQLKKRKLSCPHFKTRFHYEDIVHAEEGGTSVSQGIGLALTDVHVWCKCPECGEESDFTVKFKSGDRTSGIFGDTITTYDLNEKLRNYMDK